MQGTVEYRTERSEGGYAAKALARRADDRTLPKASMAKNERRRRAQSAAQRPSVCGGAAATRSSARVTAGSLLVTIRLPPVDGPSARPQLPPDWFGRLR